MPKQKTHRGAAKRLKITASGKVKRGHSYHTHILNKKSSKRKRKLRHATLVSAAETKMIKKLMPYA